MEQERPNQDEQVESAPTPQVERLTRRLDHSVPEPAIFDDAKADEA